MPSETVSFDEDNGPISIEITSGYASIGQYQLLRRKEGEYVQIAADRPRRIDDEVPDAIPLPTPAEEMDGGRIVVQGNYKPAPGHQQVKVTYTFTQDGEAIHETEIEDETGDEPFLRYSHRFRFEAQ